MMPRGRPSKYRPEYANQAKKLCKLGATDAELADFFEVDNRTLMRWKASYVGFRHALKTAKEPADERVERSLYQRAIAGDVTACIFWLKNRRPDLWRDKHEVSQQNSIEVIHRVIVGQDGEEKVIDGGQVEVIEE